MKLKLIVLLVVVAILGCRSNIGGKKAIKKEIPIKKLVKIGDKYYNVDELKGYTGEVVQYNEGTGLIVGKLSLKDGLLHGEIVNYNKKGGINYLQNYKEGKVDGMTIGYYENGNPKYEREYKDGKMEGIYRTYFENGQVEYEENYTDNLVEGESSIYNSEGVLLEKNVYKNGKLVEKKIEKEIGKEEIEKDKEVEAEENKGSEEVSYTSKIEDGRIILEKNKP